MRTPIHFLAFALFGFVHSSSGIEFNLHELRVNDLDGAKVDFYFLHEANRVFYRPPPMWTSIDSADRFEATPPTPRSGRLIIRATQPVADAGFPGDHEGLESFTRIALSSLTGDAVSPKVIEAKVGKVGGGELPCTFVTVQYQRNLQDRMATFCYASFRPEIWLQFAVDAAKEDYVRSSREAFRSLEAFTEVKAER